VGDDVSAIERSVRERAARLGRTHGVAYAELFARIVIEP
jgi:hypothetical protein